VERLYRQYERQPYPHTPIEVSCRDDGEGRWLHSLTVACYRRDGQIVDPQGRRILDAGCGSGYRTLALAEANPGAQIVGVDISETSLAVARRRLAHHGFGDVAFHPLPIERVEELGLTFDYINCEETLYLLPDPKTALAALARVLAPRGILRLNLHDAFARQPFLRAQAVLEMLGVLANDPAEPEMLAVKEMMEALKPEVYLRKNAWDPYKDYHFEREWYQMNWFLQGDRGFTIPETFALLDGAGLEMIALVDEAAWNLAALFPGEQPLPEVVARFFATATPAEHLHFYDLVHGARRLIDFWCGHRGEARPRSPLFVGWQPEDYRRARIHLPAALATAPLRTHLQGAALSGEDFDLLFGFTGPTLSGPAEAAGCLLALWEGSQPLIAFLETWVRLREAIGRDAAVAEVTAFVRAAEAGGYLFVEL